jgi:hypothetical protein
VHELHLAAKARFPWRKRLMNPRKRGKIDATLRRCGNRRRLPTWTDAMKPIQTNPDGLEKLALKPMFGAPVRFVACLPS